MNENFNKISFKLNIRVAEKSINTSPIEYFSYYLNDFQKLNNTELNQIAFEGDKIIFYTRLLDEKTDKIIYENKKTFYNEVGYFKYQDMINNILEFEIEQNKYKYFKIDTKHIYFNGIYKNKQPNQDTYYIAWDKN